MTAASLAVAVGLSLWLVRSHAKGEQHGLETRAGSPVAHGSGHLPERVPVAACETTANAHAPPSAPAGDPRARAGAQRGLAFVAANATAWQAEHNCYGCHVQAVTLEALTVGRKNQYDVTQAQIDTVLHGMLDLSGGAHQAHGLSYQGGSLLEPAKAFGGAAFAHYDAAIDERVRTELLGVAEQLLTLQAEDGHVGDYANGPVAVGPIQTTTQSLQTWRQAYERTGDDRWLAPMRRAEGFIQKVARGLSDAPAADLEQVDYAVVGLVSAGASRSEAVVQSLARTLLAAEAPDGGWGATRGTAASPLVTGATLYALRLAGLSDQDAAIAKGTRWLLSKQAEDGGWSHGGSSRGEAMWAVLGLVSLDMLTVDLAGVDEGEHVQGKRAIRASARDNGGDSVRRVDVAIDDVTLASVCGDRAELALDAAWLGDGAHTIDVTATNAHGKTSRRRVGVYAGAYYLTELGTRFEDNGTTFALRNLAPADVRNRVELHVYATRLDHEARVRDKEVFTKAQDGAQGPMRFFWDGKDAEGKLQPRGAYVAELRFVGADGVTAQAVETPFVEDTVEAQAANYAEISGALSADGQGAMGNTKVDLVDDLGRVVQSVKSTAQGNYQFRGVAGGKYRVRVQKDGYDAPEAVVAAAPAAKASAPLKLQAK